MENEVLDDDRAVELSTIAAIFPELQIDSSDPYHATLELPVAPLTPLKISFAQPTADGAPPQLPTPPTSVEQDDDDKQKIIIGGQKDQDHFSEVDLHEIAYLPPLRLDIRLGEKYPTEEAPKILLDLSPQWLPRTKLRELESDAVKIWEDVGRDQTVFSYIDHLQQQAESAFGFSSYERSVPMSSDLKLALLDFDLKTKREKFEHETHDCGVCLEPKKGKDCHKLLLCGHVFCTGCLQDFFNNCINEGDVDNVKCINPSCGKDKDANTSTKKRKRDRTLNPSELLQIPIEQELVQRYVRLKRKKRIESDKTTIYCPRQWCQGAAKSKKHPKPSGLLDDFSESEPEAEAPPAVKKDTDIEKIPMSDRLVICEDCDFAFCLVCKKGWHGVLADCSPRREAELKEEEKATLEYLQKYSTPCPTCSAPCQKTMGCNHMICFKCNTHFCYLCSSYLMPDNPYKHFNDPQGQCYMRLWVLEGGDGTGAFDRHNNPDIADDWFPPEEDDEPEEEDEPAEPPLAALAGQDFEREEDSDSDDSEPAPDIRRREPVIEIVNFAANGVNQAQRIALPVRQQPQQPAPPQAPDPPRRRRGRGQQARRVQQMAQGRVPADLRGAAPAFRPRAQAAVQVNAPQANAAEEANDRAAEGPLPRAAPGQDAPNAAQQRALDRFLELAQRDEEDEWDSDELDSSDDEDALNAAFLAERVDRVERRQRQVRWNRR